jgi:hypothetical protein
MRPGDAWRMAERCPNLLRRDPRELEEAADELQDLLGLQTRGALARSVLHHHPKILLHDPATWGPRLEALAGGLGVPADAAAQMVRRQPTLLYLQTDSVLRKLAALGSALGVDAARAGRIAAARPGLLLLAGPSYGSKVSQLATALGLPRDEAVRLCRAMPTLLLLSPAGVAANRDAWEATAAGSGHVRAWLRHPPLLVVGPHVLAARWRLLQRLSAAHAPWADWMSHNCSPGSIITRAASAWWRAEFLVERLRAAGVLRRADSGGGGGLRGAGAAPSLEGAPASFYALLVGWSDERLEEWQPGFAAWRAARKAREEGRTDCAGSDAPPDAV